MPHPRPLPPLAALFTTDGHDAPHGRPEVEAPVVAPPEEWELPLDDEREYGLSSASGQIQIVPPNY